MNRRSFLRALGVAPIAAAVPALAAVQEVQDDQRLWFDVWTGLFFDVESGEFVPNPRMSPKMQEAIRRIAHDAHSKAIAEVLRLPYEPFVEFEGETLAMLPHWDREIKMCGPDHIAAGIFERSAGDLSYRHWKKIAIADLPNDLVSIEDLERAFGRWPLVAA